MTSFATTWTWIAKSRTANHLANWVTLIGTENGGVQGGHNGWDEEPCEVLANLGFALLFLQSKFQGRCAHFLLLIFFVFFFQVGSQTDKVMVKESVRPSQLGVDWRVRACISALTKLYLFISLFCPVMSELDIAQFDRRIFPTTLEGVLLHIGPARSRFIFLDGFLRDSNSRPRIKGQTLSPF